MKTKNNVINGITYVPSDAGCEVNNGKSDVVPNLSYSLKEILHKFRAGIPPEVMHEGNYLGGDIDDVGTDRLIDRTELDEIKNDLQYNEDLKKSAAATKAQSKKAQKVEADKKDEVEAQKGGSEADDESADNEDNKAAS
jgi:hypothetical protein